MILEILRILVYLGVILPLAGAYTGNCDRVCGEHPPDRLPSPFGFSSGCKIQLNCTSNKINIHNFPIQNITSDTILVKLPAECGRPVKSLRKLFSANYAPTSHNGLLLQNCSSNNTACLIPSTMVQTRFELQQDCGNDTISCYAEQNNQSLFIDYQNLTRSNCGSLFSAISVESFGNGKSTPVSLEVQLIQLGWWLRGSCDCSDHANCSQFLVPGNRETGYRCRCLEGFVGDGYKDGSGCRKESTSCGPSKYMSGECGGTTRVGVLVGGVAAGASLMISIVLICCYIRRRTNQKQRKHTNRQIYEATGISIPVYQYKEIEKATNFFSDKRRLGNGSYGTVYSGKLNNDEWVAIKRIKYRDTDSIEQVINEIKLLSAVDHPNLVRLLGCSIEEGEQILVYEFMPNGTLSEHLQRIKGDGLSWPVRLTIAAETAQAIAYLHNAMHPPIYHRDVKSSNILLDYSFKSKVADFGLSRLGSMVESSHISTAPQGTPGYVDPQYHQDFHLSDKSDVYSFGVVLVEIITSLKAVDFSRRQNEVNLAALAVDRIGKGCLDEIIDPFLEPHKDSWTLSSIHKVAELAFRCLAFHRDMRPSMIEAAIELEQIRLSQWTNSDVSLTSLSDAPSYSSSSNLSALTISISKPESDNKDQLDRKNSLDNSKDYSPISMLDSLPSEQSSPSSNCLLSHAIQ